MREIIPFLYSGPVLAAKQWHWHKIWLLNYWNQPGPPFVGGIKFETRQIRRNTRLSMSKQIFEEGPRWKWLGGWKDNYQHTVTGRETLHDTMAWTHTHYRPCHHGLDTHALSSMSPWPRHTRIIAHVTMASTRTHYRPCHHGLDTHALSSMPHYTPPHSGLFPLGLPSTYVKSFCNVCF